MHLPAGGIHTTGLLHLTSELLLQPAVGYHHRHSCRPPCLPSVIVEQHCYPFYCCRSPYLPSVTSFCTRIRGRTLTALSRCGGTSAGGTAHTFLPRPFPSPPLLLPAGSSAGGQQQRQWPQVQGGRHHNGPAPPLSGGLLTGEQGRAPHRTAGCAHAFDLPRSSHMHLRSQRIHRHFASSDNPCLCPDA